MNVATFESESMIVLKAVDYFDHDTLSSYSVGEMAKARTISPR